MPTILRYTMIQIINSIDVETVNSINILVISQYSIHPFF